jgi:glutathione synthase/RimK-type ligase-like ATP-grasp enzyme
MSKTLIVSDYGHELMSNLAEVLTFKEYLANYPKANEPTTRVINLCDTQQYLSEGYYCSLLAEARQHEVLPSVRTIIDINSQIAPHRHNGEIQFTIPFYLCKALNQELGENQDQASSFELPIYFGKTGFGRLSRLANYLFLQCRFPLITARFVKHGEQWQALGSKKAITRLSEIETSDFYKQLETFTLQVWRTRKKNKKHRWDMAILINAKQDNAPSDDKALHRFVKAASQLGIHAELIEYDHSIDYKSFLARFDALFIRETTSIKSHTYELAREAEKAGIVLIDDPASILRCCNKVFLHDAFSYHKIPSPHTHFVTDCLVDTIKGLAITFAFPMILKLPESAFSLGVYKVNDEDALLEKLQVMLKVSAVVLVQEYLYTEYDWRIGILNNKPIFACRYYMAPNHWQIYNHANNSETGAAQTLPTFEVPKKVLASAINACRFIGNGLYGVDIKEAGDKAYVIEVNDNPNIDTDVEDKYLGKELYMLIMQEFVNRLEARGR